MSGAVRMPSCPTRGTLISRSFLGIDEVIDATAP